MDFKGVLKQCCDLLDSHGGRDKVIRSLAYLCLLSSDLPGTRNTDFARKIAAVGSQFTAYRTVSRLFDDFAALQRTLNYGFGTGEKDSIFRYSMLASNIISHFYYICEHIAWAADRQLIPVESKLFWRIVSGCWVATTYLGMIRTARSISSIVRQRRLLLKTKGKLSSADITDFRRFIVQDLTAMVQQLCDLGIAVNLLPGFLWGGKLKPRQIGVIGLLSSLILLAKTLRLLP